MAKVMKKRKKGVDIDVIEELDRKTKELEESRLALLNILDDVEEARRNAEEEKNKTLAVITNFTDGLLVFDNENRLILINPQAVFLLGVKNEDIVGKSIEELSFLDLLKPLTEILTQKTRIYREELPLTEKLILEVSSSPLIFREKILGKLVILHDITREKMVERMKTEFVSLAAHQLRTPLSVIKWTLKTLLDRELGELTPEQHDFLERTYQSNERMISLINDLLNITRIEEGRYLYKKTLTSFEQVVQSVVNSYQSELERKRIRFYLQKPENPLPLVEIDVEKMTLAFQNIFDNAIRYTPPGGEVTVSLLYGKRKLECQVKDSGMGIPKDQQSRVFSKFFRAANVLKVDTQGTGLGLFIAKNIIEAHGGRIWFESEEGMGTTFYFNLPVKEDFR